MPIFLSLSQFYPKSYCFDSHIHPVFPVPCYDKTKNSVHPAPQMALSPLCIGVSVGCNLPEKHAPQLHPILGIYFRLGWLEQSFA